MLLIFVITPVPFRLRREILDAELRRLNINFHLVLCFIIILLEISLPCVIRLEVNVRRHQALLKLDLGFLQRLESLQL